LSRRNRSRRIQALRSDWSPSNSLVRLAVGGRGKDVGHRPREQVFPAAHTGRRYHAARPHAAHVWLSGLLTARLRRSPDAVPITFDRLLQDYAGGPLEFGPGSRYSYSNTGYISFNAVLPWTKSASERPRQESNLGPQPSHSLHTHPAHPEDGNLVAARRGIEPGHRPTWMSVGRAVSNTAVRSGTLAGCVVEYPDLDLNQGCNLRRVACNPLHHRDMSTSARSRTPWSSFGGCRLSQEHTRIKGVSEGSRTLTSWFTARHAATATPQTPSQLNPEILVRTEA
jgi:hypothetical protein